MDSPETLIKEYENHRSGWGITELMLWVRRAYKVLKECEKDSKQRRLF